MGQKRLRHVRSHYLLKETGLAALDKALLSPSHCLCDLTWCEYSQILEMGSKFGTSKKFKSLSHY